MLVKDIMTISVSSLPPEASAAAAVKIMHSEDVGAVPICDVQGHVLGIVTDRDILMRGGTDKKLKDIMSTPVFTADLKEDVHDAALRMSEHGVRRLPVLENDRLAGMLSLKDLAGKKVFIAEIGHIIYDICNKKP